MTRPAHLKHAERLTPNDVRPLVGADGPDLSSALQAIITWVTSTAFRERLMLESRFPLENDLPGFLLVNQLIYRGAARPTDLADAIGTGRSNVSKIVRRLEEADLVLRGPDPRDDRAVVVVLTGQGKKVAQQILDAAGGEPWLVHPGWTKEEAKELERLLIKLAVSFDALPDHPLRNIAGVAFP
ncbi:MarR family winged helix-turn-helix transcriptional regulator [Psychromicrobium sp. YIM B11713]|uniref:MarR family winged helix-turn-helix transcriptional regulator n=1 Tax=Psychromicrobium sp. YIM B11713 TaxID=3145233 RepID=UPI00374E344F